MLRTGRASSLALASLALASLLSAGASAQQPAPPPPDAPVAPPVQPPPIAPADQPAPPPMQPGAQPVYPQQPPPGYGQPVYPQQPGYPPQGYAPQGYGYPQYGYAPPQGPPPPPPAPKGRGCCRWSARFNPFELLYRRLTFEAEVAVVGPLTIGVSPSWIFGSPYENIDTKGFTIAGEVTVYLFGKPMSGIFLKGHFAYENFTATLTNPESQDLVSAPQRLQSAVLGGMFGSTEVFGKNGGFAISGGIGIGVATHGTVTLTAPGNPAIGIPSYQANLYDKFDKIRLLGSLGLGIAF